MAKNLYILPAEAKSGKSVIALGLMEMLQKDICRVGFFRPIIDLDPHTGLNSDIELIRTHFQLDIAYEDIYAYTFHEANELMNQDKYDVLLEGIISKYQILESQYDFILCEGTDFESSTSAFELDINIDIASNIGAPVLAVISAKDKTAEMLLNSYQMAIEAFENKGVDLLATIINRVDQTFLLDLTSKLKLEAAKGKSLLYVIPEIAILGKPTMEDIMRWFNAEVLYGKEHLGKHISKIILGAMQIQNFVSRINEDCLIVTPGDRADIILAALISQVSTTSPDISGILLTGGLRPEKSIAKLIEGWTAPSIPILAVKESSFYTTQLLHSIHVKIMPSDTRKIARGIGVFEEHVNVNELRERLKTSRSERMTPMMFEHGLTQQARSDKQHIVLPEGVEDRILKAAEILLFRGVVNITLLGKEDEIRDKIKKLGLRMDGVRIIYPHESPLYENYSQTYYELRKHKGVSLENARDMMDDYTYFGTMMVHLGDADGMVSGAVHTTQHTIRPAFEFIRTKPGISTVSSVFFMCLKDKTIVYGDCAVIPVPDVEQLAEIALSSAETAQAFGIEPRVAMLSYSTGSSGKGAEVEKVIQATKLAKERAPHLKLEGPLQYDAAIDPEVAKTKMPNSDVAGKATVFIFPDLNTGNNTYKAVQRSAQAVAIGPVLQGLNKPINDLSRGCTVADVVNTIAITAIQAQQNRKGNK
ncbi:phosphate acetyltransferase [Deltaproteobacteria bacterium TL4]